MKRQLMILGPVLSAAVVSMSAVAADITAAPNVANTSNKGSLIVFPKIDVHPGKTTLVYIQNDSAKDVSLKCYWVNGTKFKRDFEVKLTKWQPFWIDAATGEGTHQVPRFPTNQGPFAGGGDYQTADPFAGELKCWAVNKDGTAQIRFNHLAGQAKVLDFSDSTAYEYNSWDFRCYSGATGEQCGPVAGRLDLDGVSYDACPKKLIASFTPQSTVVNGAHIRDNDLTVATCNQDLTQDRDFYFTKLAFNVWNEWEVKYSDAFQCIDSWIETSLSNIQTNGNNFIFDDLQSRSARFKVKGVASTVCNPPDISNEEEINADAGLVGLLAEEIEFVESEEVAVAGTTLNTVGTFPGFILFEPQQEDEERR